MIKKHVILPIIGLFLSLNLFAQPDNFLWNNQKAVFVDFKEAVYTITFDLEQKETLVQSDIAFDQSEEGHIIFDLIDNPDSVAIDGLKAGATLIHDPDQVTSFRIANSKSAAGMHTLTVTHKLTQGVTYESIGVSAAFFMTDLSDRSYLERYLPANLEYDHYNMTFMVHYKGLKDQQKEPLIFTNGNITHESKTAKTVSFPAHFTASSVYFHTAPEGKFLVKNTTYKSRLALTELPITIYGYVALELYEEEALKTLAELEEEFGLWPHKKLVIYGSGRGGMEYCGATRTSLSALSHELTHSYYARGVMPINGNAGWVDEAIASWRGHEYRQYRSPADPTAMAGHSQYRRTTDMAAYSNGAQFMGYLDHHFSEFAGLGIRPFLADFFQENKLTSIYSKDFRVGLEKYFNVELTELFDEYINGRMLSREQKRTLQTKPVENSFHPILTQQELRDLL